LINIKESLKEAFNHIREMKFAESKSEKEHNEDYRRICVIILIILGIVCFLIAIYFIYQGNILSALILFGVQIIIFILALRYRYIKVKIAKVEVEAKA